MERAAGRAPIDSVLTSSATPRAKNMPASVTKNGASWKKWIMNPIDDAEGRADRQHQRTATAGCQPCCSISVARMMPVQPDDRADRQVDPAGEDDERHADGGDAEVGVVAEEVEEHAGA